MSDPLTNGVEASVLDYVRRNLLYTRPDFPLTADTLLLEDGILDSMGVIELVGFLQERFGITLRDEEISEENLGTVGRIGACVRRVGRHAA